MIPPCVNVIIITSGVALFMGGGNSTKKAGEGADTTLMGAIMLSISLCFDGATGAYEDKLMGNDHVEPFDLMFNIQLGKAVISFCTLVITNGLLDFIQTLTQGGIMLVLLGITGAIGQVSKLYSFMDFELVLQTLVLLWCCLLFSVLTTERKLIL